MEKRKSREKGRVGRKGGVRKEKRGQEECRYMLRLINITLRVYITRNFHSAKT